MIPNERLLENVEAGDVEAMKASLLDGADPNQARKRVTIVVPVKKQALVKPKSGLMLGMAEIMFEEKDDKRQLVQMGEPVLALAILTMRAEVVACLLEAGADPNLPLAWSTPSYDASQSRWTFTRHELLSSLDLALSTKGTFNKRGASVRFDNPPPPPAGDLTDEMDLVPALDVVQALLEGGARVMRRHVERAAQIQEGVDEGGWTLKTSEFAELFEGRWDPEREEIEEESALLEMEAMPGDHGLDRELLSPTSPKPTITGLLHRPPSLPPRPDADPLAGTVVAHGTHAHALDEERAASRRSSLIATVEPASTVLSVLDEPEEPIFPRPHPLPTHHEWDRVSLTAVAAETPLSGQFAEISSTDFAAGFEGVLPEGSETPSTQPPLSDLAALGAALARLAALERERDEWYSERAELRAKLEEQGSQPGDGALPVTGGHGVESGKEIVPGDSLQDTDELDITEQAPRLQELERVDEVAEAASPDPEMKPSSVSATGEVRTSRSSPSRGSDGTKKKRGGESSLSKKRSSKDGEGSSSTKRRSSDASGPSKERLADLERTIDLERRRANSVQLTVRRLEGELNAERIRSAELTRDAEEARAEVEVWREKVLALEDELERAYLEFGDGREEKDHVNTVERTSSKPPVVAMNGGLMHGGDNGWESALDLSTARLLGPMSQSTATLKDMMNGLKVTGPVSVPLVAHKSPLRRHETAPAYVSPAISDTNGHVPAIPRLAPPHSLRILLTCVRSFEPRESDEVALNVGDAVLCIFRFEDSWCAGTNKTTAQSGYFPLLHVGIRGGVGGDNRTPERTHSKRSVRC
ncbi:hypothetical protein M427DRAFT_284296 [Gonapodya prolifera JEL478]|uniref:SH3 domain-containing protein n=1 Tax=Gonapodya prolifera (strain JEL478) TaxID=1344416 RepID=A0A139AJW9_GONPJ|nr:hypothetical protein M427DRAFT_284296 [Gonapodya prolifera JEL478]|eukprot:KXS16783.1 hypothetical protein M427DRAFT_284296 [Gonapodya prolifera JEL478]